MATRSFSLVTFIQELRRFLLTRAHIASKKFVIPLHSACDKYTYAPWVYFVLLLCVHLCIQYKSCIWRLGVDVGSHHACFYMDPGHPCGCRSSFLCDRHFKTTLSPNSHSFYWCMWQTRISCINNYWNEFIVNINL